MSLSDCTRRSAGVSLLETSMNFNHLHYFHVIAEEGSLSRAAKQLHLSQPTLSTQLKQLEDYFGTRLFDRSGGGLRLNASGRKALEITRDIFHLAERLEQIFPAERPSLKVRLEIGMATTVARSFAIDRFVKLFKSEKVLTRVRQGDHDFLLHELISSGLDLLITDTLPDQRKDRGTEFRVLSSPEFVIICGSDRSLELTSASPAGMHNLPFVHYTNHSSYRFAVDQFFREHQVEPKIVAEADDVYLIRDSVAAGVGLGIVPRAVAESCQEESRINIIGSLGQASEIYALYNRSDPSEEVIAALDILSDIREERSETEAAE